MGAAPKLVEGHSYAGSDYNGAEKNACDVCVWKLSVRHGERMVEPAPARTKRSLASVPGQGHLLPGQCRGGSPALAGKSPMLPGAARVSPDLVSGKSFRVGWSFL